jgi:hypothetical protein
MTDSFRAMIDKYRARMTVLREAFQRDHYLYAVSTRNPSYAIFLTRNGSSLARWRVTSFSAGSRPAIVNTTRWNAAALCKMRSGNLPGRTWC